MTTDTLDLFTETDSSGNENEVQIGPFAEQSYLEYSMSVVLERAIPLIQDGQKPGQRRILYSMYELGNSAGTSYKKSARIVGDVLGKYHPHGDTSVYDAAVRMAQDFSLRYPLIDGQGNFGSRDGDNAAAMRYTEVRLTPLAELLLSEIDRGTVDFTHNYDGTLREPEVLPARLPMLLLNGVHGVAVGLATSIPSHSMREVGNAALFLMDHPKCSTDDLMVHIPGPDFPTAGQLISQPEDIRNAFETGQGSLRLRARWEVEQLARGQWRVIVNELPYGRSVESVLSEIEELSNPKLRKDKNGKEKKTLDQDQLLLKQAINNLLDAARNESDKDMRLVLEPKTSRVDVNELMNFLLAHTGMEDSFSYNMVSIGLDGRPAKKNLKTTLQEWIDFRLQTVLRRCKFDLEKAEKRIHILEGRKAVMVHIDEVIRIIRETEDPKAELMARFNLSDIQAEDILEIRLRQLAKQDYIKLEAELNKLLGEAKNLKGIIESDARLRSLIKKEIAADIEKYGDDRRTLIKPVERAVASAKAFVVDEPVTILLSRNGWIRSRQGHSVERESIAWKPGDSEFAIIETRTTRPVVIMDSNGRTYSVNAVDIPGGKGDGVPVTSLIDLQDGGKIQYALAGNDEDKFLFVADSSYGFIAPLKGLIARPRAGKTFMKVDKGQNILPPLKLGGESHIAAFGNGRMLVFALEEMNEYPNGGKGVIVMDVADKKLEKVLLCDGSAVPVIGKRGKERVIAGEELQKYLLKRARKGCQLA